MGLTIQIQGVVLQTSSFVLISCACLKRGRRVLLLSHAWRDHLLFAAFRLQQRSACITCILLDNPLAQTLGLQLFWGSHPSSTAWEVCVHVEAHVVLEKFWVSEGNPSHTVGWWGNYRPVSPLCFLADQENTTPLMIYTWWLLFLSVPQEKAFMPGGLCSQGWKGRATNPLQIKGLTTVLCAPHPLIFSTPSEYSIL